MTRHDTRRTEAAANNGYLNVDAVGTGTAAANGKTYEMAAIAVRSAWVGTATQATPWTQAASLAQPAAVMRPSQADLSSQVTSQMENATWAAQNSPVASDASDDPLGNPDYAEPPVPTDQYGYQEVGGNGTYNPNLAADGTDLTNAPITAGNASNSQDCCLPGCAYGQVGGVNKIRHSWTIVGQWDNNWDDGASFSYAANASSNIGVEIGIDGKDFDFAGYDKYSTGSGFSQGLSTDSWYDSHQVALYMEYDRTRWAACQVSGKDFSCDGTICYHYQQWDEHGVVKSPAGHFIIIWHKIWKDQSETGTRWRTDNCKAFINMLDDGHYAYEFNAGWPYSFDLTRDAGLTYGFAADLGGIGVRGETDHSTATDTSVFYNSPSGIPNHSRTDPFTQNPNSTQRYFWGSNRAVDPNGGPQPKAVYNC